MRVIMTGTRCVVRTCLSAMSDRIFDASKRGMMRIDAPRLSSIEANP